MINSSILRILVVVLAAVRKTMYFEVLSGAEVNVLKDGSLDISNNVLDKLDVVGAAIHSNFEQPVEVQTQRLVKAAQNLALISYFIQLEE
jgi:histidinol phosphatase-like PHP family hydrolase